MLTECTTYKWTYLLTYLQFHRDEWMSAGCSVIIYYYLLSLFVQQAQW